MTDSAWITLSLVERMGGKTLRALLRHFNGDARAALAADFDSLCRVPGIGAKMAERIQAADVGAVERMLPAWEQAGVQVITLPERAYPARLRGIGADAPPTLFQRGQGNPWHKAVAVVGTRQPSPQAVTLAENLGAELASRGYTVVSGMALGVDSAAHRGALSVAGRTIAVLGCGVLNLYPSANEQLAEAIIGSGAVLSEFHPQAAPAASNLVARNRVISGLSEAVIVVETESDGGAMHAARFASAQGRPIYTFQSKASGNRALIDSGATVLQADFSDLPF